MSANDPPHGSDRRGLGLQYQARWLVRLFSRGGYDRSAELPAIGLPSTITGTGSLRSTFTQNAIASSVNSAQRPEI
jgi:hypothetical protein